MFCGAGAYREEFEEDNISRSNQSHKSEQSVLLRCVRSESGLHLEEVCSDYKIDNVIVKASSRKPINEALLVRKVRSSGDMW